MRATAVIPAVNEGERIGRVLEAVAGAKLVGEVIVVDDGSVDDTAKVAASADGARVVRLPRNRGKGAAMWEGARRAGNGVLVFLDADLVGLRREHVDDLVRPVLEGEVDMAVGQFRGGNRWVTLWQRLVPAISGQRALRASDFLALSGAARMRFGIEVALTRYAARRGLRTRRVYLPGMSHVMKERKCGLVRGLGARAVMYSQMGRWLVVDGYQKEWAEVEGKNPR